MKTRPYRRKQVTPVDDQGMIEAYHSSADEVLIPHRMLHVGTMAQATMRGGRHMHRLTIRVQTRMPRLRDHGSWNVRTLMRHARRSGLVVYLNRTEGIPLEEFERARVKVDIDRVPDSTFRRLMPSAADSWIVLNPEAVVSVERLR